MTTPTGPITPAPRIASIPKFKILSTDTIEQKRRAFLFFGDSDTGKTYCALTFPNPLVIYFDTNLSTLRKFKDVPFLTPTSWLEVERDILPAIRNRKLSELAGRKIETIIWDSLTFYAAMLQAGLTNKGKMEMQNTDWSSYYAGISAVVQAGAQATKPLSSNPDAECYHFICTVHKTMRTGKKGEVLKIAPTVDGQMRDQLHSFFDAVLCFDSQSVPKTLPPEGNRPGRMVYEKQRFAWTIDPDPLTKAKNHIGPIDPKVIPTYENLARFWELDNTPKATPTEVPAEVGEI